ncbi:MAG: hypothetical protein ACSLFQ_23260 [Thermoanaerobaculia bacterium]
MAAKRLDEIVLTEGLVDEMSLSAARTEALSRQRKLAEVLIDLGLVDQRSLAALLARESESELVSPIEIAAVQTLAKEIPTHLARRHQIVAIRQDDDGLVVAMIDPFEPGLAELVEAATGMPMKRAVGVRSELEMAVLELYGIDEQADVTLLVPRTLSLELGSAVAAEEDEYSGIPDEWSTTQERPLPPTGEDPPRVPAPNSEADSTAPSTAGGLSDSERIAHVERQLLNVSRALALIQSRLDTIDARLVNLAGQRKVSG